jgi:hypothetical protein
LHGLAGAALNPVPPPKPTLLVCLQPFMLRTALDGLFSSEDASQSNKWAGVQEAHFIWFGLRNARKCWTTSLVVKLWEIAWDVWDHRNQIELQVELAQDAIMRHVCLEHAFGRPGLPRKDWQLFKRPLQSLLCSSLHCLDAWILRLEETARTRKDR